MTMVFRMRSAFVDQVLQRAAIRANPIIGDARGATAHVNLPAEYGRNAMIDVILDTVTVGICADGAACAYDNRDGNRCQSGPEGASAFRDREQLVAIGR